MILIKILIKSQLWNENPKIGESFLRKLGLCTVLKMKENLTDFRGKIVFYKIQWNLQKWLEKFNATPVQGWKIPSDKYEADSQKFTAFEIKREGIMSQQTKGSRTST